MTQSGHLETYSSRRLLVRGYRWRRISSIEGERVTLERSDHLYLTRWSAKRGALRACPGIRLPVVELP